jgi:hypothetical protein
MSSARQRSMRGGWALWRWPPTIRGMSWSAVQHLVDARLDIGTVAGMDRLCATTSACTVSTVGSAGPR